MLRIAAAADSPACDGFKARPPAVPLAWPSGVAIDGDVVVASLLDRTRWLTGVRAEAIPGRDRSEVYAASKLDDVVDLDDAGALDELGRRRRQARRASSSDRGDRSGRAELPATLEDRVRALRALRAARARRLARALIAAVSRAP